MYSGNQANYGVATIGDADLHLADLRAGSPDGTDTVTNVEYFQFADGTISSATLISQLLPVVIEAIGTTSLVLQGGDYLLNPTAGGTGPELKYQGSPVVVGRIRRLCADRRRAGVEWLRGRLEESTTAYSIWSTDANGNYTGNFYMPGSGHDAAFETWSPASIRT